MKYVLLCYRIEILHKIYSILFFICKILFDVTLKIFPIKLHFNVERWVIDFFFRDVIGD